ncbi:MAG: hypothetical protein M3464_10190 [Chloroflexota bacterium]|nr:hypothetical protein [Chloroflexota bacterium]
MIRFAPELCTLVSMVGRIPGQIDTVIQWAHAERAGPSLPYADAISDYIVVASPAMRLHAERSIRALLTQSEAGAMRDYPRRYYPAWGDQMVIGMVDLPITAAEAAALLETGGPVIRLPWDVRPRNPRVEPPPFPAVGYPAPWPWPHLVPGDVSRLLTLRDERQSNGPPW